MRTREEIEEIVKIGRTAQNHQLRTAINTDVVVELLLDIRALLSKEKEI